jgi:2-polyprenyl-3-methyl-5-hydroxy-6-metoxy-1,4-benzoquinol methylase
MNWLDRALQRQRVAQAAPWVRDGARVLDVGCFDDTLFTTLGARLGAGVGLDPLLERPQAGDRFRMEPGAFPDTRPAGPFDVITMLAVLEHVADADLDKWAQTCRELLVPRGLVVATVPQPAVDKILDVLMRTKLADGMEFGQHHGMAPEQVLAAFVRADFDVVVARRFQFGLNNLFVFSPK